MYLLTDLEENDRTVTTEESSIFNELKSLIFETPEVETSTIQIFDVDEQT